MSVPPISKENGEKRIYAAPEYGCTIPTSLCSEGLNSHLYVTYRFIIADLVMSPFAYFLERRKIKAKDDTSTGSRVIFALSHRVE
ncbi:Nodulin MtN21/EamA-like transporter family protein [Gossypium australe]|uniref:Nodulin MtN21/EamA-like transporter family protein n=1 Tax=Gossypium australe TaxID=47621 RepID=A0A5B6W1I0_9ROSI|nr:Nodulin MtN21/EamA-like transporter family protein [Gossypium australe]